MTYFNRIMGQTTARSHAVQKLSQHPVAKERIYKDDDVVHSTLGTIRRTAAEKRALDKIADRHLRFRI